MGKASILVKITLGPFLDGKKRAVEWEAPLASVAGGNAPQLSREFARLEQETARLIREGLVGSIDDDATVMDGSVVPPSNLPAVRKTGKKTWK